METSKTRGTAFVRSGPAEAPVAVLIHGLGLNRDCWQWTGPALQGAGYQVLAYDLYGHGDSDAPPETPSLELFSWQLKELLDSLEIDTAAIVGFSLGGMIARRFAQDYPERTTALAILHSAHRRTPEAQKAVDARVLQVRGEGPSATVDDALNRWFTEPFRIGNPGMMDLVRGWVLANDPAIYPTVYEVLAGSLPEIIAPEPPITCPALVLTGDEDFGNNPEMARAIAGEIPGAQLHILEGLRHMAMAERPAAVNVPLAAFLNTVRMQEHAS